MKSTLMLQRTFIHTKVSLVKITLDSGSEYYEVAEWNQREKRWIVVTSNLIFASDADQVYHNQCDLAEKAERYHLR